MRNVFLFFVLAFCGCLCSYGQDLKKELKTEEDGFKWYWLYCDGFSGAQDVNGKDIIPLSKKFDAIGYRTDLKLFQITIFKGDDYIIGFYGLDGKSLIEPGIYDEAYYWNEAGKPKHFTVKKGGKCGICDKDGKEVIPLLYDNVYHSNGNFFEVYQGDYRGICRIDGTFLIPLSRNYEWCIYKNEGWYMIKRNGYFGACDLLGKEIVKPDKYTQLLFYSSEKGGICTFDDGLTTSILVHKFGGNSNNYSSNSNSYANTTTTTTTSQSSSIKEMFDLAYNTPDAEAQTKYNRYMQVIKADPYNSYGYKAAAYNNIGVLYESLGDLKNAKACYEYALQANPNYEQAKSNLKNVKAQRRSQRWNNISNALGAVGEALGTMSGGQTNGTYNTYQGDGGSYSGSSGGSSSSERTCVSCGGSGKCATQGWADKYRCHGSGRCQHCSNSGIQSDYGNTRACSTCNGTKKCHYCGGSGRCSTCGGSGKR